ncbi:CsbD family protein [Streptomyces sp. NPDC018059]|uniref:CsbD family protein n=1 Tax=Streptomyces sp. NPDC018059 TaxID=3365041 RepID=UPI0037BE013C
MGDKGGMDKLKGKAKQMTGKATGDKRREAEGRTDRTKGEAKGAMESARDKAQGMKDSLKRDDS